MSKELKSCCVSGHIHEGTPKGEEITLFNLPTYIANPEDGSKEKTVVFLTDIFGYKLCNTRLLADEWAAKGYRVLLPDILFDDPIPESYMNSIIPNLREQAKKTLVDKGVDTVTSASLGPWLVKHRDAVTLPIINDFLSSVRADSEVKKIIAVGFCFGGRHAIVAANKDGVIDAAVAYHPSMVSVPNEIIDIMKPTLISVGDADQMLPMSEVEKIQDVIKQRKATNDSAGLEVKVYEKAIHGFAVRGDLEDKHELETKEKSFSDALAFLDQVL